MAKPVTKPQQPDNNAANPQEELAILDPGSPLYNRALQELGITNPVYYCRIVGNRLRIIEVVGRGGIRRVLAPRLTEEEQARLQASARELAIIGGAA